MIRLSFKKAGQEKSQRRNGRNKGIINTYLNKQHLGIKRINRSGEKSMIKSVFPKRTRAETQDLDQNFAKNADNNL